MLFRVLGVALSIGVVIFCFKELTFDILLAPSHWDFMTYRWLESAMNAMGIDFHFQEYHVKMIATELSSQFMTHLSTSFYLGLLFSSPYILYELFRFISPALGGISGFVSWNPSSWSPNRESMLLSMEL